MRPVFRLTLLALFALVGTGTWANQFDSKPPIHMHVGDINDGRDLSIAAGTTTLPETNLVMQLAGLWYFPNTKSYIRSTGSGTFKYRVPTGFIRVYPDGGNKQVALLQGY